ncbi:MAG: helix-turn-helix transcriptional regulator [Thiotrichales bacterium]|nr:helix-turn-helix transcriptional regulator [Thiotrichales bacterium]
MNNLSGRRIRDRRKELNMGQVELAAAMKVDFDIVIDQSDISEIERDVRGIKDFELDAIARILDISLVWLLRGEG